MKYKLELDKIMTSDQISAETDTNENRLKEYYTQFIDNIKNSIIKSTQIKTRKLHCKTLPKYLVDLIKIRKQLSNKLKKTKNKNNSELKKQVNNLTTTIRLELNAIREAIWLKFCNSIEKVNKNSSKYWQKIKQISSLETTEPKKI